MTHATAVACAQVAADPVVVDQVTVGARADRDAAGARGRAGEQRVTDRRVVRDRVVMHVHVHVQLERNLRVRCGSVRDRRTQRRRRCDAVAADRAVIEVGRRRLAITHVDAARERAVIGEHPRIGDLEVVRPAVDEHAAATLRAVGDADTIDTRRVAVEIGCVVVATVGSGRVVDVAIARGKIAAAIRERAGTADLPPEVAAVGRDTHAAAHDRDARAFVGAHQ